MVLHCIVLDCMVWYGMVWDGIVSSISQIFVTTIRKQKHSHINTYAQIPYQYNNTHTQTHTNAHNSYISSKANFVPKFGVVFLKLRLSELYEDETRNGENQRREENGREGGRGSV